ncbi:unnamed protein product [Moneuplotes crassus]|uniref:Uncharacterized protein n=2 Tax=Euplotes crassus TaxID=5936 RepID=A0AAD1XKE5_EUPCR|nr:unnamed protein product [Moneuplotes crassus]
MFVSKCNKCFHSLDPIISSKKLLSMARIRFPERLPLIRPFPVRYISEDTMRQIRQKAQITEDKMQTDYLNKLVQKKSEEDTRIKFKYRKGVDIIHNEEIEGTIYKYDLPIENQPIQFRNQLMVVDEEHELTTPTMNLYEELDLDKDSSYEQYVIKVNQNYNHEVDMYGDIKKAGSASLKVLQFGIPIPHDLLDDKLVMSDIRLHTTFNQDMPGAIENVHPNKFIANLRPVEEFRHTPVIPISEKDLKELQKKKDARNRQGYFVEIKKDTVYYYTITLLIFSAIVYALYISNEMSLNTAYDIDKAKVSRLEIARGSEGLGKISNAEQFKMPKQ